VMRRKNGGKRRVSYEDQSISFNRSCFHIRRLPVNADKVIAASESHPNFCVQPSPPQVSTERWGGRDMEAQACGCRRRSARSECRKYNMSCVHKCSEITTAMLNCKIPGCGGHPIGVIPMKECISGEVSNQLSLVPHLPRLA
jgi:hypothetical protein